MTKKESESKLPNYHCPACGELAELIMGPTQAFCTNDEMKCRVISFNPSLPDGGMSNVNVIDFNWSVKAKEPE